MAAATTKSSILVILLLFAAADNQLQRRPLKAKAFPQAFTLIHGPSILGFYVVLFFTARKEVAIIH